MTKTLTVKKKVHEVTLKQCSNAFSHRRATCIGCTQKRMNKDEAYDAALD